LVGDPYICKGDRQRALDRILLYETSQVLIQRARDVNHNIYTSLIIKRLSIELNIIKLIKILIVIEINNQDLSIGNLYWNRNLIIYLEAKMSNNIPIKKEVR
jgi:hypothetical protein